MPKPSLGSTDAPASSAQQQALLDFAVSQSPAIFYIADLSGESPVRFISANVETITGHKPSAFLGDAGFGRKHIHPDDLSDYEHGLSVLQERGALTHEYRFATAAGEFRWFRDDQRLIDSPSNRTEFVGCMIDITAEKTTAQSLTDAQAFKTAIIEAAQDAIVAIDSIGLVVDFNAKAEDMFGHRREDVLGRRLSELIIPERLRSAHEKGLRRLRQTGASHMLNERVRLDAMRPDGTEFPIELTVVQTTILGRAIYVAEIRDVSEKAAGEAERQRLLQLLEDAVESLPNGFTLWDSDDRVVLANTAFGRSYGLVPAALKGMSRKDVVRLTLPHIRAVDGTPIEDSDKTAAKYAKKLRHLGGQPMEIELANGEWKLVTVHTTSDGGQVGLSADITALKHKERVLEDSERRFRMLVESHPLPVWLVELESGRILYSSPATAELTGHEWRPEEEHFVQDYWVNPADREDFVKALKDRGEVRNYESRFKRSDGSTIWVSATSRLLVMQGRDLVITSLVDLTAQRNREAELRQAREILNDAIESLSEGLALYDADNRLVLCNSQYRSFHRESEDLLVPGAYWPDVTIERAKRGLFTDAAGRLEEWFEGQMAQRGTAINEEFPFSGDRWFEYSHRPTRQGGFVSTWRDITERKKMEQALRESEAQIRHILEACPVPITLNRAEDGVILYESPAARALLRYDEFKPGMSVVTRWVNPDERPAYLERLRRDGAVDGLEIRYRKVDGEEFWAAISSRLIDYLGEEVIVSNLVDLTERHAAEAELVQQREMLHQAEKLSAFGELLAGVAHELNNPLSVLVGQALMLQEELFDEPAAARAEKIGKAADRCARIVKTFLAMARQQPTEIEPVDINAVIESALEVTAYPLRTGGVEVTLRLAKDLPTVMASSDQMRQVFTNLIVNAQNAVQENDGPRQLRITSSYRQKSERITIKVKDNGPGIPNEIRSRIFEPLFTTKEVGAGTGIGLALCHRIIEAHGGTIVAEKGSGQGAVFVVRLPRGKLEDCPAVSASNDDGGNAAYRVLVVDDDYDVGQIMSDVLEHEGYAVEVVGSGRVALERVKHQKFDVILCDIRMPGMDGPGFYRALTDARPEQVDGLAFITGDTMTPKVREFLEASERPYLEKPILPRDIRELVDLLLRRKAR